MAMNGDSVNLSAAKSGLSELVRRVRRSGKAVVITVDGEPAARIAPIENEPRSLTHSEMATIRSLMDALARIPRSTTTFDAVTLVADGRR